MVAFPMLVIVGRAVWSVLAVKQAGNMFEQVLKPLEGPDIPLACRRYLQAQDLGDLGVAQLFEMSQGDDLPVDRLHAVESGLDLDLDLRP